LAARLMLCPCQNLPPKPPAQTNQSRRWGQSTLKRVNIPHWRYQQTLHRPTTTDPNWGILIHAKAWTQLPEKTWLQLRFNLPLG
ncbi:MAG: hypothetical protein P8L85_08585, partial [Rubripirellula sp.]|nr:hypothetical protein [Rubripirellula sp.]